MSKSGSSASPSSWPHYDDDQIAAVARVLASGKTNYWTGSECRHFEREFAIHFDMPFAISLANGTVALELALIAFGIGHDDEVIVPAASYIASAGCVAVRGARPVFADVDEHTQNISAKTIEPLINSRTRAVIVVHLHGVPCDMAAILKLAKKQKLLVIEDCAQAHGAQYRGQPVGSLGDAAAFSFCQDKIISTGGEGGMLLFRDRIAWQNGWSYKDHGKTTAVLDADIKNRRGIYQSTGSNWRMTEVQAAIGRLQLKKLDSWVRRRRQIAARWLQELQDLNALRLPQWPADSEPAWYRFPMRLNDGAASERSQVLNALQEQGIVSYEGICPELYREPVLAAFAPPVRLPNARKFAASAFSLAVNPMQTDAYVKRAARILRSQMQGGIGCIAT